MSFSNATRDLVFGHFGTGTSYHSPRLPRRDAGRAAQRHHVNVTVEQGDEVILSSGVYKYLDPVVGHFRQGQHRDG